MATSSPSPYGAKSTSSSSSSAVGEKSGSTTQGVEEEKSSGTTENRYQDSTEDFLGNPTRDTLAEGLIGLLTPTIEHLDQGISGARGAQLELKGQLGQLEAQLQLINEQLDKSVDLEPYVIKLLEAKKKVIVINSMLQEAQDRLNRVHQNCLKETAKRRTLLEQPATSQ